MSARERLLAKTMAEVRADHRHRYEWVSKMVAGRFVIDAACGCGYGSAILSDAGCRVLGLDYSQEAIDFAEKNWRRPRVEFRQADLMYAELPRADAAVSFETIEHLKRPKLFLRELSLRRIPRLFVSVPHEDEFPFATAGNRFHFRHYTARQLQRRLLECGWDVIGWYGQAGKKSPVTEGPRGRTIIAEAVLA